MNHDSDEAQECPGTSGWEIRIPPRYRDIPRSQWPPALRQNVEAAERRLDATREGLGRWKGRSPKDIDPALVVASHLCREWRKDQPGVNCAISLSNTSRAALPDHVCPDISDLTVELYRARHAEWNGTSKGRQVGLAVERLVYPGLGITLFGTIDEEWREDSTGDEPFYYLHEASIIAQPLVDLLATGRKFEGSAPALLHKLSAQVSEDTKQSRQWPKQTVL